VADRPRGMGRGLSAILSSSVPVADGGESHPELRDMYFGNYKRVVLISQSQDASIIDRGRAAARRLGLEFEHRHVGLEPFSDAVTSAVSVALSKRVA